MPVKVDLLFDISSCLQVCQQDTVSKFFQFFPEIRFAFGFRTQVDIIGSKFMIGLCVAQYVVDRLQDRMSYCY